MNTGVIPALLMRRVNVPGGEFLLMAADGTVPPTA
jgi:hypothetical protein